MDKFQLDYKDHLAISELYKQYMSYWATSNNSYGSHYSNNNHSIYSSPLYGGSYPTNSSKLGSSNTPSGLQNLGNTCYISAILQVLFPIIKQTDFSSQSRQQEITSYFFKLKRTKDRGDYKMFKEVVEDRIQIVKGWDMQDAHQFLVHLLEEIRKQNPLPLKPGKADLSYKQGQNVHKNWERFSLQMMKLQNSKIIGLFYGDLVRKFTCPKDHYKFTFQRYMSISLSFSPKSSSSWLYTQQGPITITSMIKQFCGVEQIDDLQCQKCKRKTTFTKQLALYTAPKYLILHLSRFIRGYYTSQKNDREVEFDDTLTIDNYKEKKSKYSLIGVVHHTGTLNRGHYFADVLIQGSWYEMNDERVYKQTIRSKGNVSSTAYLLLYQKC